MFTYGTLVPERPSDDGPIGIIRALIPDRGPDFIFSNGTLRDFHELEGMSIKRTVALALETMAQDDAYKLKVITSAGMSVDGVKVANTLIERAADLRTQAANEAANEATNEAVNKPELEDEEGFEIV